MGLKMSKRILGSMILLIFILGFFSKTAVNYFLPRVSVYEVRKMPINTTVKIKGQLKSKDIIKVRLAQNVMMDILYVQEGDAVKAGDPLFKVSLASSNETNNIEDINLEILSKEAALETLRMRINPKDLEIKEEELALLRIKVDEKKALYDVGAVSEDELIQAEATFKAASNETEKMRLSLEVDRRDQEVKIKTLEHELSRLYDMKVLLSEEDGFYSHLEDQIYYAKEDGVILEPLPEQTLASKDQILLMLAPIKDQESFIFEGLIDIDDLPYVAVGTKIELENESMEPIQGTVTSIGNISKGQFVTIKATLDQNAYGKLFLDMDMTGTIEKRVMADLALPKSAILTEGTIKTGDVVTFYAVDQIKGLLGDEYVVSISKGSVGHVGDLYVSLNTFTLEGSVGKVIINPSYKVKVGERVLWERE